MFDHELTHVIASNIVGKTMLIVSADRWFDEGLATLFSANNILSKSDMTNLITLDSSTKLIPTNIINHDDESIWNNYGKNANHFYPAYNSALRYAMYMGASKSDLVDIVFKIREIEDSCKVQQEDFYYNNLPTGTHGSIIVKDQFSYCDDTDVGYETTFNGEIIGGADVLQVAFDEVMSLNGSGLTMSMLKDNDYFVNHIINGFLK